ncbi:unnamed protein product [Urochloa decumbens]|uniref:Disease resistance N-terminal domain-containing protein n=1 Tax=Urochloa decumbens TaxID=240449 RepID=A0ABC8ZME6_9POAL
MEVLLSAVGSDLVGRLISFLISKFQEPGSTDDVVRLQRALLRARVVVEEAERRQVANQAMLQQLNQLRGKMCRGAYMLDTFIRRAVEPSRRSHATARRSVVVPPGSDGTGELSVMVGTLEAALSDMKEFVVLLGAYPRLNRQPYSSYLFMERCLFGRQMEKEQIMSFLLQPAQDFEVLPIIGPHEVGKRTLVEHVCLEERVRDHFAKIHRLSGEHLDLQSHEHHGSALDLTVRSLILVDLSDYSDGDAYEEEEQWRRLLASLRHRAHRESKIIIISGAEKHSSRGTVPPIRLRAPRREELWYLFKALAFGGADPEERPDLVGIAMALFKSIPDLARFDVVNKLGVALRADLNARFWRRVLKMVVGVTQLQLGAAPGGPHLPEDNTGYYYPRMPVMRGAARAPCLFYDRRKSTRMLGSKLPEVTMFEVVQGVVPGEKKRFDVLVWQSRIPPYASYVATCDMERAAQVAEVGKKQIVNKRRRDQPVCGSGEDKVGT